MEYITKEKLLNIFETKELIYCFAVHDKTRERSLIQPEKYKSNIAKYSLIELNRKMNNLNVGLNIIQIN